MPPRGRPRGSKDKPRTAGALRRGRPPKNAASDDESDDHETRAPSKKPKKQRKLLTDHQSNPWSIAQNAAPAPNGTTSTGDCTASTSATAAIPSGSVDADDKFGAFYNEWELGELEEITRIEREALAGTSSYRGKLGGPFFSLKEGFAHDSEDEDEGMESQNEDDLVQDAGCVSTSSGKGSEKAWFIKPKGMPHWEYDYIWKTIQPIIRRKDGRKLAKPSIFREDNSRAGLPPTLWIRPLEPIVSLSKHRFDPTILYRRRIFLWLPHFFVDVLWCPNCGAALEKNGPLVPRRITDLEDSFYIVSWGYYCRHGCKHHFHGWTTKLAKSLPRYLQLAFPAILSRKGGLSRRVLTLLRGANQHKMGPTGYPSFGDFGSPDKYNGFVPSVSYLTSMMNKAIELEEADADQHTACLSIEDLCIDDNHKVNKHIARVDGVPIFGAMWTCMSGFSIHAQALTLTKGHDERLGPLMGIAVSAKLCSYSDLAVVYSDDPVKDKSMLLAAFPTLSENLTPMAAAHGLKSLSLPLSLNVNLLGTVNLVDSALSSLISPLDIDPEAHLCVFLIGSAIKGDLTRLKKQFPQLLDCTSNIIDLKQFAIRRGVIKKNTSGALDTLAEKVLGVYFPKDATFRKTNEWEMDLTQRPELLNYAALDVFASRLIFEKINKIAPLDLVQRNTPAGTPITLLVHEGGEIAAYGRIASSQPATFAGVRNSATRVLIDIDLILLPSAAAILHLDSSSTAKSGALTLSQLQLKSSSPVFQILSPLALLQFDHHVEVVSEPVANPRQPPPAVASTSNSLSAPSLFTDHQAGDESDAEDLDELDLDLESTLEADSETLKRRMLEAHGTVSKGKQRAQPDEFPEDEFDSSPLGKGLLEILHKLAESPADIDALYTRIKKDIFHAFHMIPIPAHGLQVTGGHAYPRPQIIKEHVPRYVPPPSVLVPAIQHVYDAFGNALDAETGQPLFDKKAWAKANAVLELAREGYLSDIPGVLVYERAGVDEYGLWKWICRRGSNKLEGGPHSDIFRKFGALNAGPRLTVNSLTDHRTRYNLQAFAKHQFGVNWDYHFNLGMLNRTSFLLNYLSDVLDGASSYSNWINTDLYERTNKKFGICPVPEVLRTCLNMASYSDEAASKFELNPSEDWLRRRQGVSLPILPPTTLDARKYFFTEIRKFAALASSTGKKRIDFEAFAREWNGSADGKTRQYVTGDVLSTYSKTWEKISNIRASQDLIVAKIDLVRQTGQLFSADTLSFPPSLKGNPTVIQPQRGVITLDNDQEMPDSISVGLANSHPQISRNLWYGLPILISRACQRNRHV
ncbi:hypothetical protein B0H10DRAFT_1938265 [Mycena sp. CBHHK59/15]|nr:hypothetical protein B0H10DRAFT_1938265 [Mycena sp. CBHHK59/15]